MKLPFKIICRDANETIILHNRSQYTMKLSFGLPCWQYILLGSEALSSLKNRKHRQNNGRPEKSKKNSDEKLDKYLDKFSLRRERRRKGKADHGDKHYKNSCCKGQSFFKSIKLSARTFRMGLRVSEGRLLCKGQGSDMKACRAGVLPARAQTHSNRARQAGKTQMQ